MGVGEYCIMVTKFLYRLIIRGLLCRKRTEMKLRLVRMIIHILVLEEREQTQKQILTRVLLKQNMNSSKSVFLKIDHLSSNEIYLNII